MLNLRRVITVFDIITRNAEDSCPYYLKSFHNFEEQIIENQFSFGVGRGRRTPNEKLIFFFKELECRYPKTLEHNSIFKFKCTVVQSNPLFFKVCVCVYLDNHNQMLK